MICKATLSAEKFIKTNTALLLSSLICRFVRPIRNGLKIFQSLVEEIFVKWTILPKQLEQDRVKPRVSSPQRMLGYVIQKPCKNHLDLLRFCIFGVFAHSSQLNTFKAGLDVKVTNVRQANGGSLSRFYCELKKRLQVEKGKLNLSNSLDSGITFHSEKKQQKITGSFYIDDVLGFHKKRQTLYIRQKLRAYYFCTLRGRFLLCVFFVFAPLFDVIRLNNDVKLPALNTQTSVRTRRRGIQIVLIFAVVIIHILICVSWIYYSLSLKK